MPFPADRHNLVAYAKALKIATAAEHLCARIPERRRDLRDQLRRSSASILLNVAEGAGEFSPADKNRFYRFARRSATESISALDLLAAIGVIADEEAQAMIGQLIEIVAITTAMVRKTDRSGKSG